MNKNRFNILFLVFILAIALNTTGVNADDKKTLGVCSYDIDTESLGLYDHFKSLKLDVTVYNDGSTDGRRIYGIDDPGNEFSYDPTDGLFLLLNPVSIILSHNDIFANNGEF